MVTKLKVGARGSPLSLAQTGQLVKELKRVNLNLAVDIIPIKTAGDDPNSWSEGGQGIKGLFVREIELALLDGRIDLAVHSAKDMSAVLPEGLTLGAVPPRASPFDCLVVGERLSLNNVKNLNTLENFPLGSVVGTSSLRRRSQLLAWRKDLDIRPLRGNLGTRLGKMQRGEYQAVILARAGLDRLGEPLPMTLVDLPYEIMLPAPGQGLLALECRLGDKVACDLMRPLDHLPSALALAAERAFMARLGVGCQTPAAAWARFSGTSLIMDALVASLDGTNVVRRTAVVDDPDLSVAADLGSSLAVDIIEAGGASILRAMGQEQS